MIVWRTLISKITTEVSVTGTCRRPFDTRHLATRVKQGSGYRSASMPQSERVYTSVTTLEILLIKSADQLLNNSHFKRPFLDRSTNLMVLQASYLP